MAYIIAITLRKYYIRFDNDSFSETNFRPGARFPYCWAHLQYLLVFMKERDFYTQQLINCETQLRTKYFLCWTKKTIEFLHY